ncbi:MAG: hypothetical protein F3745_07360 [Nitrospinae bacterium]|nr:hypothetical protein [Nitrospinota bacterium]
MPESNRFQIGLIFVVILLLGVYGEERLARDTLKLGMLYLRSWLKLLDLHFKIIWITTKHRHKSSCPHLDKSINQFLEDFIQPLRF